jgi:hypothetical protein
MICPAMIDQSQADLYVKLTLKEWGFKDYKCIWRHNFKRTLGLADPWDKRIYLSTRVLANFRLFRIVLLHEIQHLRDFSERGTFKNEKGKNDFHGKNFRRLCREVGIPWKATIKV